MNQTSNKFLGFIPALVVDYLFNKFKSGQKLVLPEKQCFHSVVMFADISGFTNLTEKLSKRGAEGSELIAFALNRYMELLVNAISRSGGDIFKFAGDAMIVLWPPPKDNSEKDLTTLCRQAIQSALDIQARLNDTNVIEDIKLSVKIGFGIGEVTILHVGGVFSRAEYLAAGEPLLQAFEAEHCAKSGGVIIISNQVWNKINSYFEFKPVEDQQHHGGEHNNGPFYYVVKLRKGQNVQMKADALLITNQLKPSDIEALIPIITPYMPAAVVPYLKLSQEKWSAELRRLSVMFVNLGIDLSDAKTEPGLKRIQLVIETVQKCVYKYQGSLNKLLMDDKGSTLIVVFGLPPMAHQDDPVRATLTAIDLIKDLKAIACACSIGVTTGLVFAGVVGTSGNRREYSILGDSVNLAARLMQAACGEKLKKIFVDEVTRKEAQCKLAFRFVQKAMVKGKSNEISFFEPISLDEEELNIFPYNIRTHNHTPLKGEVLTNESLFMVGKERDATLKRTIEIIDKFIKKPIHNIMFLFSGMYGIGKSLMLRNLVYRLMSILEKNTWRNGEICEVFISSLNCANRERNYNGWVEIIKKVMRLLSLREKKSYENLISDLLKNTEDMSKCYVVIEKFLDITLQQSNILKSAKKLNPLDLVNNTSKFNGDKILKKFISELFKKYTNNDIGLPIDLPKNIFINNETFETVLEKQEKKHTRGNYKLDSSPPLIIVLDDMQDFDVLSWKLTKRLMEQGTKMLIIGAVRSEFLELKPIFLRKKKYDNDEELKNNEDVIEDGIFDLEEALDNNVFHKLNIGEIDKEDIEVLLRKTLNFGSIEIESEEREKIKDPMKWLIDFLATKAKCVPFFMISLMENLRAQHYLVMNENHHSLIVKPFLVKCIEINEGLTVKPPLGCDKINGPIIDHLACHEIILLKAASVIGDTFDFRNLTHINPLKKTYNNDKLLSLLDDLVRTEFLEILDENDGNIKYRMTNSFMRESLYQRMIYAQRRQLHRYVAEALQEAKPIKGQEVVDNLDCERLIYHWSLNENLNPSEDGNLFKVGSNFSSKAKRSIVVKKISSILSRNQRDFNVILIKGKLEKKSDRGVSWSTRYCVLNTKELKYFYSENGDKENSEEPLGSISLKHIYNIIPLDETVFKQKNAFIIYTGQWTKKNKEMGIRNFYFSALTTDELEEWKTYIEFVRAKAIYDDFVNTFGKISFPLSANAQEDLEFTKTSYKEGENQYNNSNFNNEITYNRQTSPLPKSSIARKTRRTTEITKDSLSLQAQSQGKVMKLKQRLRSFIIMSFIEVTSHLAQISHNARHNIDREEEELTLGKTNNFLKNNASLLHHIFEDKEDDSPEEKDQFSIKFSEQERSPIKRKSIKYHSHIENIEDPKESKISKQKSGSATIPGIVHILPPEIDNTVSPTLRVSPVQTYIKKITIQLNNSKELNDHEEETKINKTQRFSPKLLALTELKSSFNDHTTSNELSSLKKSSIAKETKNMKESIKFNNLQSKAENNSNFHVCIPQNPFSQVTIDYNSDAEKIAFKQVKEDRFEGQTNFNYSFNPRKEKKIDRDFDYPEIISKIQKNDMFEAAGFALNDSISLKPNNNFSQFDVFEIKKGESVCIRLYKEDSAFIECKFYEKIGIFKKKDFYFWENKMSFNQKDEDISSPTSQDGPMKPKFFKTSHR